MAVNHQAEKTKKSRRWTPRQIVVTVGIAILPLIYGGLLTSAYQDPVTRMDHVQAAVVNEDKATPVKTAAGATETVDLGGSLTKALTEPAQGEAKGFTWTEMDKDEAQKALSDQRVRAVLTIPAGLSAGSAPLSEGKAPTGEAPELRLITDDGISYLAGNLATQVGAKLQEQVSTQGAEAYVNGLLLSMSTLKAGLDQGAGGAAELANGADTLQSGAGKLAIGASSAAAGAQSLDSGAQTLANGSAELADGMRTMANGAQTAAGGAGTLNSGLQTLSAGAAAAEQGTAQYAQGVQSAADGASALAAGAASLGTLSQGVDAYTGALDTAAGAVPELAAGAGTVAGGAETLNAGVQQLSDAIGSADAAADPSSQQLVPATKAYVAGVHQLDDALSNPQLAQATEAVTATWGEFQAGVGELETALNDAAVACQDPDAPPLLCEHVATIAGKGAEITGKVDQLGQAVNGVTGAVTQTQGAVSQLADKGDNLEAGVTTLAQKVGTGPEPADQTLLNGSSALAGGAGQLRDRIGGAEDSAYAQQQAGQTPTLAGALNDISAQSEQLRTGAAASTQIAGGASQLSDGLNQVTARSADLTGGTHQVAAGAAQLAAGTNEMSVKIGDLVSGASTLAAASGQVAAGGSTLASGADHLQTGVSALDSGASALAQGVAPLDDGAHKLQSSLADGADKVPAFTDAQRGDVAERAANVATVNPVRDHAVVNNGAGFLPMFLSLALWVGCIGVFFVFPALKRTSEHEAWWKAALRPMPLMAAMSIAQSLLLVLIVNATVGIQAANVAGLCAMAAFASFVFMLINQAAVASLGLVGRFVSLILIVFQIASMGATFPIETAPAFFGAIHPWLPMSYAQLAFRSLIAGGGATAAVPQAITVLLLWAAGALLVTLIAAEVRKGVDLLPRKRKANAKKAEVAA